MSTHASIVVHDGDKYKAVYVHSDGYYEYLGELLSKHYDHAKAVELVNNGDVSMVGIDIGTRIDFNEKMEYVNNESGMDFAKQCRFYRRDRGESGTECRQYRSLSEALNSGSESYVYIFKDGEWYTAGLLGWGGNRILPLSQDIERVRSEPIERINS